MDTVLSIRNVACPKLDLTPRSPREHLSCRGCSIENSSRWATEPATAGHLARSYASRSGISRPRTGAGPATQLPSGAEVAVVWSLILRVLVIALLLAIVGGAAHCHSPGIATQESSHERRAGRARS